VATRAEQSSTFAEIFDARRAYDRVATVYEHWYWFEFWRRNEVPIVEPWIQSLPAGRLLDAGSGTGLYSDAIRSAGHLGVAVDVSLNMLQQQKKRQARGQSVSRRLVQGDMRQLPLRSGSMEYVLTTRTLSHVSDILSVAKELRRVMGRLGQLLVTDVHACHPYTRVSIGRGDSRIVIETYKHSIETVRQTFEEAGLELVRFQEYRLQDLVWKPPFELFQKIYAAPELPIFYACWLTVAP
jgi:ubiquinone/menaquinone biosynthesis C-methylase UbiE